MKPGVKDNIMREGGAGRAKKTDKKCKRSETHANTTEDGGSDPKGNMSQHQARQGDASN